MAEITPTPRQGSWVRSDAFDGPWRDQPRQGSWVEGDPFSGPWTPQPRQGSWVRSDPVTDWPATRRPRTSVGILVARA